MYDVGWLLGLVMFLGSCFLVVLAVLWALMPFSVFTIRDKLKDLEKSINSVKRNTKDTADLLAEILDETKRKRRDEEGGKEVNQL